MSEKKSTIIMPDAPKSKDDLDQDEATASVWPKRERNCGNCAAGVFGPGPQGVCAAKPPTHFIHLIPGGAKVVQPGQLNVQPLGVSQRPWIMRDEFCVKDWEPRPEDIAQAAAAPKH